MVHCGFHMFSTVKLYDLRVKARTEVIVGNIVSIERTSEKVIQIHARMLKDPMHVIHISLIPRSSLPPSMHV